MAQHPPDHLGLQRVRETTLAGGAGGSGAASSPRGPVAASWRRVAAGGLEPGSQPDVAPLGGAELERRRAASGLAAYVTRLTETLAPVVDAGQMVVVADAEGRVLWRAGSSGVRRAADDLGFVGGSAWTEGNVGTNAIGTCLVLGEGVHIQGPEHFVESHTRWGCAAAPIRDPWSGRTLGVVDVSGPSRGMHPAELALVELAARMTSLEVVEQHRDDLDRLRAVAAPVLAGLRGDVLAVDRFGHLAAAVGTRAPARVALPHDLSGGRLWLPTLGDAVAEPLAGGWLLRLGDGLGDAAATGVTRLTLDLRATPLVEVASPSGAWSRRLTPRHAEILLAVVEAGPPGRSAAELAVDLFDDGSRAVTVRAELSRLRRLLGGVVLSGPYRLSADVDVTLRLPDDATTVLPGSSAPVVRRTRQRGHR